MNIRLTELFLILAVLTLTGCAHTPQARSEKTYQITELLPAGTKESDIIAINRKGDALVASGEKVLFYHDGKIQRFMGPNVGEYAITALNSKGDVAGTYDFKKFSTAFLLHGDKRILLSKQSGPDSHAYGINEQGDVVGSISIVDNATHAFFYHDGKMQDIGTLGGEMSEAQVINNKGDIAGVSNPPPGLATHVFLYRNGKMQDLGTIGLRTSRVTAINDRGDIVGKAEIIGDAELDSIHAFLYHEEKLQDLGTLGGDESVAESINNQGDIVGATYEGKNQVAFLYTEGKMKNLNSLLPANSGWKLTDAVLINDSGTIFGWGNHNGKKKLFLMQPIVVPPK